MQSEEQFGPRNTFGKELRSHEDSIPKEIKVKDTQAILIADLTDRCDSIPCSIKMKNFKFTLTDTKTISLYSLKTVFYLDHMVLSIIQRKMNL